MNLRERAGSLIQFFSYRCTELRSLIPSIQPHLSSQQTFTSISLLHCRGAGKSGESSRVCVFFHFKSGLHRSTLAFHAQFAVCLLFFSFPCSIFVKSLLPYFVFENILNLLCSVLLLPLHSAIMAIASSALKVGQRTATT